MSYLAPLLLLRSELSWPPPVALAVVLPPCSSSNALAGSALALLSMSGWKSAVQRSSKCAETSTVSFTMTMFLAVAYAGHLRERKRKEADGEGEKERDRKVEEE